MIIRIAVIGAIAFASSALAAGAQDPQAQKVVHSAAVMKSMTASKPKSKTPLGARVGVVRRPAVAAKEGKQAAPTSVREIGRKGSQ